MALMLDLHMHLQAPVSSRGSAGVRDKVHQLVHPACAASPGDTLTYQSRQMKS